MELDAHHLAEHSQLLTVVAIDNGKVLCCANLEYLLEEAFYRYLWAEYGVRVCCQDVLSRQRLNHCAYHLVLTLALYQLCHGLATRSDAVPSKWRTCMLPLALCEANITSDDNLVLMLWVVVVVWTCVTSGKCTKLVLDVERLDEVYMLAREQLQDVGHDTCTHIGLRYKYRGVLIEPRVVETCTKTHQAEHRCVDIVEYQNIDIRCLGHILQTDRCGHRSLELVLSHIVHHLVVCGQLVAVALQLLGRNSLDGVAVVRVCEETNFGTELREEAVRVHIC